MRFCLKYIRQLKHSLQWNTTLRFLTETFMMIAMCVFINLTDLEWTDFGSITSSLFCLFFMTLVLGLPLFMGWYMYRNYETLSSREKRERIGSLYEELDLSKSKWVIAVPINFMIRRIMTCITIVYVETPVYQIFVLDFTVLFVVILHGQILPFSTKSHHRIDVFNEVCVLVIMYHMIVYTDFVTNAHRKFEMGWSMITITLINVVVNIGFLLYMQVKDTIALYQRKKREKEIRQKNKERMSVAF